MYLNKVMIYGNLTRDPELKALPSGMQVASFAIATNRTFNDRDGKRQEQVEYHNVVAFGKQAEIMAKWLKKGSGAYIEGRLQTRSWDKDGVKQYRTEIVTDKFEFGPKSGGGDGGGSAPRETGNAAAAQQSAPPNMPDYPEEEINPEDIPF